MDFIKKRILAFVHAFNGVLLASRDEPPMRVHLLAAALVTVAGFYFHITTTEWCMVVLCFGMVIAAELLNTSIEKLCDHLHPEKHPNIKYVKDVSAGAVLVVAAAAVIVGAVILRKYIF